MAKHIFCYPDLHTVFLASLVLNAKDEFRPLLMCNLEGGKNDRKWRFYPLTKYEPFFMTRVSLSDMETFEQVFERLFSLSPDDPLLVEKSYHLLEEVVSYYKGEGQREIIRYITEHPHLNEDERWHKQSLEMIKKTHLTQDLTFEKFDELLKGIKSYCHLYRKDAYALIGRVRDLKKKRIKKKVARRVLKPWL